MTFLLEPGFQAGIGNISVYITRRLSPCWKTTHEPSTVPTKPWPFSTDRTKISTAFLWFLVARLLPPVTRWNIMTSQYIRFLVSRCGRKASANKINGNGNAQTYRRRLPSEILISILLLQNEAFFSSAVSKPCVLPVALLQVDKRVHTHARVDRVMNWRIACHCPHWPYYLLHYQCAHTHTPTHILHKTFHWLLLLIYWFEL